MFKISKAEKEFFACNNCLRDGTETDIYYISIINNSAGSSFKLCKDCFNEMKESFDEAVVNE